MANDTANHKSDCMLNEKNENDSGVYSLANIHAVAPSPMITGSTIFHDLTPSRMFALLSMG